MSDGWPHNLDPSEREVKRAVQAVVASAKRASSAIEKAAEDVADVMFFVRGTQSPSDGFDHDPLFTECVAWMQGLDEMVREWVRDRPSARSDGTIPGFVRVGRWEESTGLFGTNATADRGYHRLYELEQSQAYAPIDEATEFLKDELRSGPLDVATIKLLAESLGIRTRTLIRAKAKLKIRSRRKEGPDTAYEWVMP